MIIFMIKLVLRIVLFLHGMLWLCITCATHFSDVPTCGLDFEELMDIISTPGFWRRFLTSLVSFVLAVII